MEHYSKFLLIPVIIGLPMQIAVTITITTFIDIIIVVVAVDDVVIIFV